MKQILIILAILVGLQYNSYAQLDLKAKGILTKVSENIKNLKSMKANFKISIKDKNGKAQGNKEGSVSMKGNKYLVKIGGQEIYCDSKNIWTFLKDNNEVQISDVEDNDEAFSPSKLFTNFYDKEYAYKHLTSQNGIEFIGLLPLKKNVQFEKIVLKIDGKQNAVVGGTVYDKNGNIYTYSIYNYTKNPTLADDSFIFNTAKNANVKVIDLR